MIDRTRAPRFCEGILTNALHIQHTRQKGTPSHTAKDTRGRRKSAKNVCLAREEEEQRACDGTMDTLLDFGNVY